MKKQFRYYTGIGSRTAPSDICEQCTKIAKVCSTLGYTLRSGNATGCDQAFAEGAERAEIWLPWNDFEIEFQQKHPEHSYISISKFDKDAYSSVEKYHPAPKSLSSGGIKLMARNYRQVVGYDAPNSEFVVCWTPTVLGGTGQAIRIARDLGIPIFNLRRDRIDRVVSQIKEIYQLGLQYENMIQTPSLSFYQKSN